jgi:hypothetical protein
VQLISSAVQKDPFRLTFNRIGIDFGESHVPDDAASRLRFRFKWLFAAAEGKSGKHPIELCRIFIPFRELRARSIGHSQHSHQNGFSLTPSLPQILHSDQI